MGNETFYGDGLIVLLEMTVVFFPARKSGETWYSCNIIIWCELNFFMV